MRTGDHADEGEPCGRRGQPCGRRGQQHCCCMDDCFFAMRMLFCHADVFCHADGRGDMRMGLFVVQRYKIKGGSDENYTVNFSES